MLANPFLRLQDHKLFTDDIKNVDFIFATFETKVIDRKVEPLHIANLMIFFGWMK